MPAAGVPLDGTSEQLSSSPSNTPQPSATGASSGGGTGNETDNIKAKEVAEPGSENAAGKDSKDGPQELDDFGLPIRKRSNPERTPKSSSSSEEARTEANAATASQATDEQAKRETARSEDRVAGSTEEDLKEQAKSSGDKVEPKEVEPKEVEAAPPTNSEHSDPPPPYRTSTSKPRTAEISEWSHQRLALAHDHKEESEEEEEEPPDWKEMPALGEFDYYDDYGRLIARGAEEDGDDAVYNGLGGAGKGYTRVQLDEDAQSATSLDEDTSYLFREAGNNQAGVEGEELRDTVSQLQATKDLLNETQKIAYVGVVRLAIHEMNLEFAKIPATKGTKKTLQKAVDAMRKWGQAMMGRLYMHMDIDSAEQIMIEQLTQHGVQPGDLVRPLMQNARVKNPMAEQDGKTSTSTSSAPSPISKNGIPTRSSNETEGSELGCPPPYEVHEGEELPEVRTPSQMPTSDRIDIDLRWTVLCDLFLVLIADSTYDARSRTLLERVGAAMDVTWLQISRFEKRVTDALEMQEQADKENWDESEHMEKRRQLSLRRKFMVMGLATVGGGLVIGLSAGLLAPVIGAGLAAGFTTIGVSGTSAFLGGAGGTALIASSATLSGTVIGMRASHRRTGAVQTFEYRPLHNNKKLNLIVTVSGWMTGKVDDVRLPYSTVDPIMGDIYSVLWEPEMLRSMGDTINILATEVSDILASISSARVTNSSPGIDTGPATRPGQYHPDGFDGIIATAAGSWQVGLSDRQPMERLASACSRSWIDHG